MLLASLLNEQAYADTLVPDIENALITFEESKSLYKKHNKTSKYIDTSLNQIQAEILSDNKSRTIAGLRSLKNYFPNTNTLDTTPSQLIRLGVLYRAAHMRFNLSGSYRQKAFLLYVQAKDKSKKQKDPISLSYAEGYIGQLYSDEGKYTEAISYTQQALSLAEKYNALQMQYKWQLQLARSYKANKQLRLSILSYQKTVDMIDKISIRTLTQLEKSFEDNVAPVFYEYIDVLLTLAEEQKSKQPLFRKALHLTHLLQVYKQKSNCQTSCDIQVQKEPLTLRKGQVLIAPFLLKDRLVTLAMIDNKLKYYSTTVKYKTFQKKISIFNENSTLFYQWMVSPFVKYFSETTQIIFLSNKQMGDIPFNSMKTGDGYLKDRYSVVLLDDVYSALN